MSAITDRMRTIGDKLKLLEQERTRVQHADAYDQRRRELEGQLQQLRPRVRQATLLCSVKKMQVSAVPAPVKVNESLDLIARRAVDEPEKLTAGRDWKTLVARLDQFRKDLGQAIDNSWTTVIADQTPVDATILAQIALVPGQESVVEGIRAVLDELAQRSSAPPESDEQWNQYLVLCGNVSKEASKLRPEAYPDGLFSFLKTAQTHPGADLELLTDNVREWLAKHGLLNRLRIRIAGES